MKVTQQITNDDAPYLSMITKVIEEISNPYTRDAVHEKLYISIKKSDRQIIKIITMGTIDNMIMQGSIVAYDGLLWNRSYLGKIRSEGLIRQTGQARQQT